MELIKTLHQACARHDISSACKILAAIDIMRTDECATVEDAVLFYRATCFILAGPFSRTVRTEMEASCAAWRDYLGSPPRKIGRAPGVATVERDNRDTHVSPNMHIERQLG
jgi:hypothetical protein